MGRRRVLAVVLPRALMLIALCGLTLTLAQHAAESPTLTESGVRALLEQSQEWLRQGHASLESGGDYSIVDETMEEIQREMEELQRLQQNLAQKERALDQMVGLANAKQVEGLMDRLDDTFTREMTLRTLMMTGDQMTKKDDDATAVDDDKQEASKFLSRQELQEHLNPRRLLAPSEYEIVDWVKKIVKDQLSSYQESILTPFRSKKGCMPVVDVVQGVHVALTKFSQDGIGLVDHAQGAEIVHFMTSPTYMPPPTDHELLGNVWWRKFIPEDWERLLPKGWETWDVRLPSFLEGKISPPETILEKKVLPGSCWPMDGNRGRVTIRLPYAIQVESFSLDHVAKAIVPHDMFKTAPKKLKVIAYPPCPEPDECGALGFDAADPLDVAYLEYDLEGPTVQTFDSIFVKPAFHEKKENEEEGMEEEGELAAVLGNDKKGVAACSMEAAACSTPPKMDVAGITVEVLENHGNPDYTCIYRFRVHGEQLF